MLTGRRQRVRVGVRVLSGRHAGSTLWLGPGRTAVTIVVLNLACGDFAGAVLSTNVPTKATVKTGTFGKHNLGSTLRHHIYMATQGWVNLASADIYMYQCATAHQHRKHAPCPSTTRVRNGGSPGPWSSGRALAQALYSVHTEALALAKRHTIPRAPVMYDAALSDGPSRR